MADVRTLSPLERIVFLKTQPAISALPNEDLARFASIMTERTVEAGETITKLGAPIDAAYLMLEGRASVRWESGSIELEPPGGLNWLRLVAGRPTSREAVAITRCHFLSMRSTDVLKFLEGNPDTLENTLRSYMRQLLALEGALPEVQDLLPDEPPTDAPTEPLTIIERVEMLERSFGTVMQMSFDTMLTLARRMGEVRWPAGTQLWAAGDPASDAYNIRHGRVTCIAPDGSETEVGEGYGLGFFDAMAGIPRSQTAVTRTDVHALHSHGPTLFAVMENDPYAAMRMLAQIAGQYADLYDRVHAHEHP